MMNDDKLLDAVNRSGFPLQIGLEHLIKSQLKQKWRVMYSEHSWKNPFDGSSGFIDLVLEDAYKTTVIIVEAKKVMDTSWIFLVSKNTQLSRRHVKAWVTSKDRNYFDYAELTTSPNSVESKFCIVDGQDPKSRPMLERLAAEVVSSTEGFASEEKELLASYALRMYISVIVTTATLKVCKSEPESISIGTGVVKTAEFIEVPYLRFRKQLNFNIPAGLTYDNAASQDISRQKENTVIVVNSNHFAEFLAEFEVDGQSLNKVFNN